MAAGLAWSVERLTAEQEVAPSIPRPILRVLKYHKIPKISPGAYIFHSNKVLFLGLKSEA